MLIKALSDYYDILASKGEITPDGFSKVKIHYKVALTEDGKIDKIIDFRKKDRIKTGKDKIKEVIAPQEKLLPARTEKTGIEANIAEHRPLYLFGLNLDKDQLTPEDKTGKAKKSHEAFVKTNLEFTEGMSSPLIQAFRKFLENWKPEQETQNAQLLALGKEYAKSGFVFCLTGSPEKLLHEEAEFKEKWQEYWGKKQDENSEGPTAQCAVSGETAAIARIHSKIKGVYGGLATGSVLIGFNNSSESSYGNEQAYNSNISESVMKKYTETLNYLLSSEKHKIMLDDMTIVFWAMNTSEKQENLVMAMLFGASDKMNTEQTDLMLRELMEDSATGRITAKRLENLDLIQEDVDFYMLGLKPNSSRLALKFIYRKSYADVLWNIVRFQNDLQMTKEPHAISLQRIKHELISPKVKNDKVNPALTTKLLESVLYGRKYPTTLLETVLRRIRTDEGSEKINSVRIGIIKAVINRNSEKEELKMVVDLENENSAYLCGRMFAVLEKLQKDSVTSGKLNRTIRDGYFAMASTRPAAVFPKLLRLAQHHLKKLEKAEYSLYYEKMLEEIHSKMKNEYPESLPLKEQGKFMVGYYQQMQDLYEKKNKENEKGKGEN